MDNSVVNGNTQDLEQSAMESEQEKGTCALNGDLTNVKVTDAGMEPPKKVTEIQHRSDMVGDNSANAERYAAKLTEFLEFVDAKGGSVAETKELEESALKARHEKTENKEVLESSELDNKEKQKITQIANGTQLSEYAGQKEEKHEISSVVTDDKGGTFKSSSKTSSSVIESATKSEGGGASEFSKSTKTQSKTSSSTTSSSASSSSSFSKSSKTITSSNKSSTSVDSSNTSLHHERDEPGSSSHVTLQLGVNESGAQMDTAQSEETLENEMEETSTHNIGGLVISSSVSFSTDEYGDKGGPTETVGDESVDLETTFDASLIATVQIEGAVDDASKDGKSATSAVEAVSESSQFTTTESEWCDSNVAESNMSVSRGERGESNEAKFQETQSTKSKESVSEESKTEESTSSKIDVDSTESRESVKQSDTSKVIGEKVKIDLSKQLKSRKEATLTETVSDTSVTESREPEMYLHAEDIPEPGKLTRSDSWETISSDSEDEHHIRGTRSTHGARNRRRDPRGPEGASINLGRLGEISLSPDISYGASLMAAGVPPPRGRGKKGPVPLKVKGTPPMPQGFMPPGDAIGVGKNKSKVRVDMGGGRGTQDNLPQYMEQKGGDRHYDYPGDIPTKAIGAERRQATSKSYTGETSLYERRLAEMGIEKKLGDLFTGDERYARGRYGSDEFRDAAPSSVGTRGRLYRSTAHDDIEPDSEIGLIRQRYRSSQARYKHGSYSDYPEEDYMYTEETRVSKVRRPSPKRQFDQPPEPREEKPSKPHIPDEDFKPQRRAETEAVVREKTAGIRSMVDMQSDVLKKLKEASSSFDELDEEIKSIKKQFLETQASRAPVMEHEGEEGYRPYEASRYRSRYDFARGDAQESDMPSRIGVLSRYDYGRSYSLDVELEKEMGTNALGSLAHGTQFGAGSYSSTANNYSSIRKSSFGSDYSYPRYSGLTRSTGLYGSDYGAEREYTGYGSRYTSQRTGDEGNDHGIESDMKHHTRFGQYGRSKTYDGQDFETLKAAFSSKYTPGGDDRPSRYSSAEEGRSTLFAERGEGGSNLSSFSQEISSRYSTFSEDRSSSSFHDKPLKVSEDRPFGRYDLGKRGEEQERQQDLIGGERGVLERRRYSDNRSFYDYSEMPTEGRERLYGSKSSSDSAEGTGATSRLYGRGTSYDSSETSYKKFTRANTFDSSYGPNRFASSSTSGFGDQNFESRFLTKQREAKAGLDEPKTTKKSGKPFQSRFLKKLYHRPGDEASSFSDKGFSKSVPDLSPTSTERSFTSDVSSATSVTSKTESKTEANIPTDQPEGL